MYEQLAIAEPVILLNRLTYLRRYYVYTQLYAMYVQVNLDLQKSQLVALNSSW